MQPLSPPESPASLAELQRLMAGMIMRPLTSAWKMDARLEDGRRAEEVAETFIKPNDRLTSGERLEIYNRQYWFRLLDCLHEDYPGLRALLGNRRFQRLATAYLLHHPSTSYSLRDLGREMVRFLQENPLWAHPYEIPALEMARLEWAQVVAFDGEAGKPVALDRLGAVSPEEIHLRLQPYATLLELTYPVERVVMRLLRREAGLRAESSNAVEAVSPPERRAMGRRLRPAPGWLLVHRRDNAVFFKSLSREQFLVLSALDQGASLARACTWLEGAMVSPEEVRRWFQDWTVLELLIPAGRS